MKQFNCFWSHTDCEKKVCCGFCNKKTCEWRCHDNHNICKYSETECDVSKQHVDVVVTDTKIRTHNETVETVVKEKLYKYKKENKLHNDEIAERIGVTVQVIQKILSKGSAIKIRSDSYRKIKDFIVGVKSTSKRRLW